MTEPSSRHVTVSLTPRQADLVAEAVADGAYASSGEIIRDALSLWEAREVERRQEQQRLKAAYDDGIASGEGRRIDAAALLAELKSEARAGG